MRPLKHTPAVTREDVHLGMAFTQIADWLLTTAEQHTNLRLLTDQLIGKLCAAGVPIVRVNLGVFALHPEIAGYAVLWDESMSKAIEIPISREDTLTSTYLQSPIRALVRDRERLRFALEDPESGPEFPVLNEFRAAGHTDYAGFPIPYGGDGIAVLTFNTTRPGGFHEEEIAGFERLFPVLKLLINVVETQRLAKTVLRTYLGRETGARVLAGEILRGQGEDIEAALWLCDLRGFTSMTARIGSRAMIEVMNAYFDCMAEAVWEQGGEILKFMGDAMLVVFRIDEDRSPADASQRGVAAAIDALERLARLSQERVSEGDEPLRAGVALHIGSVVYGNIGASSRLDFTVMGSAVNLVARIQHLTGTTNEPLLFSEEIAEHLTDVVESVGVHEFKGVSRPVEVFRRAPGARVATSAAE